MEQRLALPPRSIIRQDRETSDFVHAQLTSVMAGHPQATTTYRFYEEIDAWLGPWGASGYPIGFGKLYNIAFTTSEKLMANVVTRQWVWRTTIRLQEALRDFIVKRIRNGSLRTLTEVELRQAAFDSHPHAYDRAGLATVALTAPELIPFIAVIPAAEFDPRSNNFSPTLQQLLETLKIVGPRVAGGALAGLAGPAHTGLFQQAMRRDQREFLTETNLGRELGRLKHQIAAGEADSIRLLDEIIGCMNAREFPDHGFARMAAEVVKTAQVRRRMLIDRSRRLLEPSPEVKRLVEQRWPELRGSKR